MLLGKLLMHVSTCVARPVNSMTARGRCQGHQKLAFVATTIALRLTGALPLQAGLSRVKSNLMSQVKRGKMNQQQVDKLLTKLKGTLSYDDFKDVDMVVEAVIESIDLKQKIFAGTVQPTEVKLRSKAEVPEPCFCLAGQTVLKALLHTAMDCSSCAIQQAQGADASPSASCLHGQTQLHPRQLAVIANSQLLLAWYKLHQDSVKAVKLMYLVSMSAVQVCPVLLAVLSSYFNMYL